LRLCGDVGQALLLRGLRPLAVFLLPQLLGFPELLLLVLPLVDLVGLLALGALLRLC
jgi:hypothetical protein